MFADHTHLVPTDIWSLCIRLIQFYVSNLNTISPHRLSVLKGHTISAITFLNRTKPAAAVSTYLK